MSTPRIYEGPFDREPWPAKLPATVVDARGERRIHGYCVRGDLAHGHGIADLAWLAFQGELPSLAAREALETAIIYLAPVHVGEAGSHAALLARVVRAKPAALVAVTATALAEQGRTEREALAPWLAWLDAGDAGDASARLPACALEPAPSAEAIEDQRELAVRTAAWFGAARALPATPVLSRAACAHALLHRLGLRDAHVVEALAVWARLLVAVAESASLPAGAIQAYPARLPDYQYVDHEGRSA
ncbi:MAG TPA: hypothetical protein VM513_18885 [Kofleriaceae bacterium]|jgi:hypothetical protein|nr:hypothetical protein [Kofleriaceae bacterium]